MGRFNRFPPKGIFLPSILDIYSKMKILLEAVPWLKQPNHQSWASSCWELYTSKVRDAVGEYILLFSITTTATAVWWRTTTAAPPRRRGGGQKQQLHAWQASSTQKNIVFSNLRLLLFPYNNIPLASPAIWFCSKPAIMPVEYYMLWTQPTIRSSKPTNVVQGILL